MQRARHAAGTIVMNQFRIACHDRVVAMSLLDLRPLCRRPLVASRALAEEPAAGATDESIPPAKPKYKGREIAVTMHYLGAPWLTRESRQREEDCAMLLKALDVKPGQTVCDMGCGNGFYTLQLAKLVGERGQGAGRRHSARDAAPARRAGQGRADRPTSSRSRARRSIPSCPQASVDLILLVDVYHEFSHPEQMLPAMRQALEARRADRAGRVSPGRSATCRSSCCTR